MSEAAILFIAGASFAFVVGAWVGLHFGWHAGFEDCYDRIARRFDDSNTDSP